MRIHSAGFGVILKALAILVALNLIVYVVSHSQIAISVTILVSALVLLFILRFFRYPNRRIPELTDGQVLCPADGTIVTIEEIDDTEIIGGKRTQVSIFMSVWNVHINWVPIAGKIKQILHFDGEFTRAITPKSSDKNEHTAIVIEPDGSESVMVKQIAGAVARRILTFIKQDEQHNTGDELGFIRFGSRVDVLLPLNYKVTVKLGDKVIGRKTIIAEKQQ